MDLESLGFTVEELQQKVIENITRNMMARVSLDDEGDETELPSQFSQQLHRMVTEQIGQTINAIAEKHILPNVVKYVEDVTLQTTNKWGEKRGEPITFIEYLVERANAYITEPVDHNGKSKAEERYEWRSKQTRIAHMVHEHLQYSISTAISSALKDVNSQIATGLADSVKMQLAETLKKLDVKVCT